jgi:tetratricopeptide (TPR) repeat protein
MALLNAALAFAITMLILSMVTSVFVETLHRFVGLRERGLRLMLGHLFDRVIKPYAERQGLASVTDKRGFLDLMTVNRAPAGVAGKISEDAVTRTKDLSSDSIDIDAKLRSWWWAGRRLATLDLDEFMSRLGSSPYGEAIEKAMAAADLPDPDDVLKDVAEKFDAFGREASIFFERRARLVSVLVALAVAWLMYVNPYELFSTYLAKPEVTQKVIAMQEKVLQRYETQQSEKIAEASKALEDAKAAREAAEKAVAEPPDVDSEKTALEKARKDEEDAVAKWKAALQSADDATRTLQEAGVPIGWTEERLQSTGFSDKFLGLPFPAGLGSVQLRTILWLLLGGLLVGLGGPFWYDMVKSLWSVATLGAGLKGAPAPATPQRDAVAGETAQPQTPVEHFRIAAAGRIAAASAPPKSGT